MYTLRILLEKDKEFKIQQPQIDTINKLKSAITSAPILQFSNPNASTRLQTDASSEGAMIEQLIGAEWKPRSFCLRSLNQSENNMLRSRKKFYQSYSGVK